MLLHSMLVVLAVSGSLGGSIPTERDIGGRVIGGENATIEEIPYQAALIYRPGFFPFCGGSILSETLVVTSAYCVIADTYVRVGTDKLNTDEGQLVRIKTAISHEDYDMEPGIIITRKNNIGVLFLESPLRLGNTVQPIKLPEQDQSTAVGTNVLVSGFGTALITPEDHFLARVLQKATVPIVDQDICNSIYENKVTEGLICAGIVETGGKDACFGDEGGPLAGDSVLLGIVSGSSTCGEPNKPGVYTRVAKYVNWIREQNQLYGSSEI